MEAEATMNTMKIEEGIIRPIVEAVLPLDQAREAYERGSETIRVGSWSSRWRATRSTDAARSQTH